MVILTQKEEKIRNNKQKNLFYFKYWFPVILVFSLIFLFTFKTIGDIDIGYHLRGGQWILENKSFHKNDVFTYTVNKNEYIALHWPFQIIIYLIYKISGYNGLTIFTSLFFVIIFLFLFFTIKRRNVSNLVISFWFLLSTFAMELRFRPKPEVFTYLFIILTILILDEYFHNKKDFLYLLPIIKILWTNFHGLFIIGDFIIFSYLISKIIHYGFDKKFFVYALISLLSSFVNPYHYKGFLFPFYLFTRMQSSNVFKALIDEFQSPFSLKPTSINPFVPYISLYVYYTFVILGIAVCIFNFKKFKIHNFLIFSGLLFISLRATRNIPLFLIYSIYILSCGISYISFKSIKVLKKYEIYFIFTFSIIVILTMMRVITNAYYVGMRGYEHFGMGLEKFVHPVGAAEFLKKNNLDGRIINDMNSGSWFIWQAPQPVFIDGRLEVMKEDFFKEYLMTTKEGGLRWLIDKYKPVLVSFDYIITLDWFYQISNFKDWHLIYFDENSAIYRKDGYAEEFKRPDFLNELHKRGIKLIDSDEEVWKILKTKRKNRFIRFIEGFYKKQDYPYYILKLGIFSYLNREYNIAESFYLEFLKRTEGKLFEIYYNLGSLYYNTGDFEKALFCYNIVLKEQPENKIAKNRIEEIKRIKKILKK